MGLQQELGFIEPISGSGHEAIMSIVLTGVMLAKEGDRLFRPFGLTDSQFNVLMLLKYQSKTGSMSQTELGRMLVVNRSNVTGLVDRMEQAGWVGRQDEPGDRRVKQVKLTAAGRRLLDRAEKIYFDRIKETLSDLSANELQHLIRLLEKIRKPLRQAD